MSIVLHFMTELEKGTLPPPTAREALEGLRPQMSKEEVGRALGLIIKLEARHAQKKQRQSGEIVKLIPNGWLLDYLQFTQVNEAPDSFHLFAGVAMMTHLIGRQMWYSLGTLNLYCPVSVFLVSPPGAARRSTAIKTAVRVGGAAASVLQDTVTPEGLIDWLQTQTTTLIVADEAATILSKSEYMSMMPQLMCSLLDCPDNFERKLRGIHYRIPKPTVNALIGCAPEWILSAMPKTALGGGLFSRLLVVYEERRKRLIPMPELEVDQKLSDEMVGSLSRQLVDLTEQVRGRLVYTKAAQEIFSRFYIENDREIQKVDEKIGIYYMRKPEHVHRMVMALLASGGKGCTAGEDDLIQALAILRSIESGMTTAYQTAGLERPGRDQQRVLAILEKAGGRADHSFILQRVSNTMTTQDLSKVMETLYDQGVVALRTREGKGKLIRYYQLISADDRIEREGRDEDAPIPVKPNGHGQG